MFGIFSWDITLEELQRSGDLPCFFNLSWGLDFEWFGAKQKCCFGCWKTYTGQTSPDKSSFWIHGDQCAVAHLDRFDRALNLTLQGLPLHCEGFPYQDMAPNCSISGCGQWCFLRTLTRWSLVGDDQAWYWGECWQGIAKHVERIIILDAKTFPHVFFPLNSDSSHWCFTWPKNYSN